jgi:RNA polymerase sigma factor (sigma-70 family)
MALTVDEEEIFLGLIDRHRGIIRKVAAGYARNLADQHDLSQEIMLQLWRAYPRYSPDRPFSTWMYRVALNVGISFLRRNTKPVHQTVALDEIAYQVPHESTGSPKLDERLALLERIIATFDPLNRALLLLYLDDRAYREIADVLGLSETNVATKLSRLKEHLRQKLTATNQSE